MKLANSRKQTAIFAAFLIFFSVLTAIPAKALENDDNYIKVYNTDANKYRMVPYGNITALTFASSDNRALKGAYCNTEPGRKTDHITLYADNVDPSLLCRFKNLRTLSLMYVCADSDIDGITAVINKNMPKLRSLSLCGCPLNDLDFLSDLTELEVFGYSYTNYRYVHDSDRKTDISALAGMKKLKRLILKGNNLTDSDISALSELTELEDLDLSDNNLKNISALKDLKKIQDLDLSYNNIKSIEPLSGMIYLRDLNISNNNNIGDFSPLLGLERLTFLYAAGTGISKEDIDNIRNAIPGCNLSLVDNLE